MSRSLLFAVILGAISTHCIAAGECSGSLIGQNIYSLQNDTLSEQYIFINAKDESPQSKSWQRVKLPAAIPTAAKEATEVNYSSGQFALIVNVIDGQKSPQKYHMECKQRYLVKREVRTGIVSIFKIGE